MSTLYMVSAVGFVFVTGVYYTLLYLQLVKALSESGWALEKQTRIRRYYVFGLLLWVAVLAALSFGGITTNFDILPLNVAPVLLLPMIAIIWITFSGKMKHLLTLVPPKNIVHLQVFRVFVELILWAMVVDGMLPVQMSFEGTNFDVLTGLTAPLTAWLIGTNKKALIAWNILGLILLANIVGTSILSMPTPFRIFHNDPSNTIVLQFPFILLPGMLVPLAYGLHFLSLRQLASKK